MSQTLRSLSPLSLHITGGPTRYPQPQITPFFVSRRCGPALRAGLSFGQAVKRSPDSYLPTNSARLGAWIGAGLGPLGGMAIEWSVSVIVRRVAAGIGPNGPRMGYGF